MYTCDVIIKWAYTYSCTLCKGSGLINVNTYNMPQFEWFCLGKKEPQKAEAAQASANRALLICSWLSGAEIQAVGRLLASDQLLGQWVSALAAHRIIPELSGLPIPGLSPRDWLACHAAWVLRFLLLKVGFIEKQYLHHPGACYKSESPAPHQRYWLRACFPGVDRKVWEVCFTASHPRLMALNVTWRWKWFSSAADHELIQKL